MRSLSPSVRSLSSLFFYIHCRPVKGNGCAFNSADRAEHHKTQVARARKGPKGNAEWMPSRMPASGSGERRQRREKDHLRQGGGAEPGAGTGQQFGVAPAQPLAAAQCPVQGRDRHQTRVTERRAKSAFRQLIWIE